jgi:hypothetical protein
MNQNKNIKFMEDNHLNIRTMPIENPAYSTGIGEIVHLQTMTMTISYHN